MLLPTSSRNIGTLPEEFKNFDHFTKRPREMIDFWFDHVKLRTKKKHFLASATQMSEQMLFVDRLFGTDSNRFINITCESTLSSV